MLNLTAEQINSIFPVIGIISYPGGIVIRRSCLLNLSQVRHLHVRGEVVMLSKRSLQRLALLVRSSGIKWQSIMTLTYGVNYPLSGKIAKTHLNKFLIYARRRFGDFDYFWVLEFQGRGAVHFHIATTLPEPGNLQRHDFADMWAHISQEGVWQYSKWTNCPEVDRTSPVQETYWNCFTVHAHPRSWEKVREQDGMSRYLAKYANELKQKEVPRHYRDVGRFWGTSKGVKMPDGEFFHGNEIQVREALTFGGRRVTHWQVLPKIVLVG